MHHGFGTLSFSLHRLRLRLAGWLLPDYPLPLLALQWLIRYFEQLAAFISQGGMLLRWVTANKTSKSFIAATTILSSVDLLSWILISDISSFAPQLPSFVAGSPEFEMLQKINGVILDISRKMWSASQSCAPDWYGELVDRAWFVSRCLTKLSLLYDRCQAACQQEQEKRYQVSCA